MSGSVHGQDGTPKKPSGKYGRSGISDTKARPGPKPRDRLDQLQDLFLMHYNKETKALTPAENCILAGQLAKSFTMMAQMGMPVRSGPA